MKFFPIVYLALFTLLALPLCGQNQAMADPEPLKKMGESARRVGEKFSQNREMDRLVDMIEVVANIQE